MVANSSTYRWLSAESSLRTSSLVPRRRSSAMTNSRTSTATATAIKARSRLRRPGTRLIRVCRVSRFNLVPPLSPPNFILSLSTYLISGRRGNVRKDRLMWRQTHQFTPLVLQFEKASLGHFQQVEAPVGLAKITIPGRLDRISVADQDRGLARECLDGFLADTANPIGHLRHGLIERELPRGNEMDYEERAP